jgi:hypothetical protein
MENHHPFISHPTRHPHVINQIYYMPRTVKCFDGTKPDKTQLYFKEYITYGNKLREKCRSLDNVAQIVTGNRKVIFKSNWNCLGDFPPENSASS